MNKFYYNHLSFSRGLFKFFKDFSISKPHLKSLTSFIPSLIDAESVVTARVARKLKNNSENILIESIERRFRNFFNSFSAVAYFVYDQFIKLIISKFVPKHSDNKVHISFDHMYCKNKFTILLFSLRIGKQGIPLWFRCFYYSEPGDAFSIDLINSGISYCVNLFADKDYHIVFLADRWFPQVPILSHIESLGAFYCIRSKTDFTYSFYHSNGKLVSCHLYDIKPRQYSAKVLKDIFYTKNNFKTTIVVSRACISNESWYLLTNDTSSRAVRNYSYRFGSIEPIFKHQKSNGFRLESTKTKKLEHFISLFTLVCIALVWLVIIGVDYAKNKHHYHLRLRDTKRDKNGVITRVMSFFQARTYYF